MVAPQADIDAANYGDMEAEMERDEGERGRETKNHANAHGFSRSSDHLFGKVMKSFGPSNEYCMMT